jgi:Trk K+ transport system NAD-binding subunit
VLRKAQVASDLGQGNHDDVLIERDDEHGERQDREARVVTTRCM